MGEQGNKGLLTGLIVAAALAVCFLVLWLVRGGEVDRLSGELIAARTEAEETAGRLEADLRTARNEAAAAGRRAGELETRMRDEARRAAESASQIERRLREEMRSVEELLDESKREMENLKREAAAKAERETAELKERLASVTAEGERARREAEAMLKAGREEIERMRAEAETAKAALRERTEAAAGSDRAEPDRLPGEGTRLGAVGARGTAPDALAAEREQVKAEFAKALDREKGIAAAARRELRQVAARLAEAEKKAASIEDAGRWRERAEELEKRSEGASARTAQLEKRLADALARNEELGKLSSASGVRGDEAEAGADELRRRLAKAEAHGDSLEKRFSEAAERAGELEKRLTEAVAARDALETKLREAGDKAAEAAKADEEERARLKGEYEERERSLRSDGEAARKEFEEHLRGLKAEAEKNAADWEGKLAAAEKKAADATSGLEREHAARLADAEREAGRKMAELEKALSGQLADVRRVMGERHQKAEAARKSAEARLAEVVKMAGLDDAGFGLSRPGRSVGKVVERLPDGQTLLISGGRNQRVRPGMRFDLYRQSGERNRHIGTVRVIRALDDFSMVVSNYDDAEVAVCPVTGRAVLEPDARFSPFARGDNGEALPLKKAREVGLSLEAPAIGDFIDNPFYSPERRLTVAVPEGLSDRDLAIRTVEAAGCVPRLGDAGNADYVLVDDAALAGPDGVGGPKRVTLAHLAAYLETPPGR